MVLFVGGAAGLDPLLAILVARGASRPGARALARATACDRLRVPRRHGALGTTRTLDNVLHLSLQRFLIGCSAAGEPVLVLRVRVHGLGDRGEEFLVRLRLAEALEQELGAFDLTDGGEHLPQQDDLLHDLGREEHLLAARARRRDVDGGERAALLELAVEDHLGVAGALELFVDHVVHAAAGVDETGGEDRERARGLAVRAFDVAGGAEEALRRVERDGVHTTGERAARRRHREVVCAREARHRVEEDRDVATGLDQSLRALERELGDARVVLRRLVEGRREDLALDRAADVGDFLGSLADEHDHDVHVGVVPGDAVRDVLEQRRLAGLRRRHDERALSEAERVHEVDEALAEVRALDLEVEHLVGEDGRERFEERTALRDLGVDAVDGLDAQEAEVLLIVFGWPGLSGDVVAGAQTEAAHLARADVHVVGRGKEAAATEESEAVFDDLEDALGEDVALGFGLCLKDAGDELGLERRRRDVGDAELLGDRQHVLGLRLVQLGDRVVLAARRGWRRLATRGRRSGPVGRAVTRTVRPARCRWSVGSLLPWGVGSGACGWVGSGVSKRCVAPCWCVLALLLYVLWGPGGAFEVRSRPAEANRGNVAIGQYTAS